MVKCKFCGKEIFKGYLNGEISILEQYETEVPINPYDSLSPTFKSIRKHSCKIDNIERIEKHGVSTDKSNRI